MLKKLDVVRLMIVMTITIGFEVRLALWSQQLSYESRALEIVASMLVGTIAALVILALVFERTHVPEAHDEIGWVVQLLGCGLMAWKVRPRPLATLLLSAGFLAVVHYAGFYVLYACWRAQ